MTSAGVALLVAVMMVVGALLAWGVLAAQRAWRADDDPAAEMARVAAREQIARRFAESTVAGMAAEQMASDFAGQIEKSAGPEGGTVPKLTMAGSHTDAGEGHDAGSAHDSKSDAGAGAGAGAVTETGAGPGVDAGGDARGGTDAGSDSEMNSVAALVDRGIGLMSQFEFTQAEQAFAAASAALAKLQAAAPAEELPSNSTEQNGRTSESAILRDAAFVIQLNRAIAVLNQSEPGAQERAIAMLRALLSTHPAHFELPRVHYCLGLAHAYLGDPEQALPHFESVAQSLPNDGATAYQLAQAFEMLGRSDVALAQYQRAAALDPFLRSALLGKQRMHARAGQEAEAAMALDAFMKLEDNPRSRLTEFKYTRMGALSEAIPLDGARGNERISIADRTLLPGLLFDAPQPLLAKHASQSPPAADAPQPATTKSGAETAAFRAGLPIAVDLDGDGRTDLFIAGAADSQGRSVLLRQRADGSFERVENALTAMPGVRFAAFADFDNDGLIDALMSTHTDAGAASASATRLMRRTGETSFEQVAQWEETNDALWADLDHDGDLDLVLAISDAAPRVLMQRAIGEFEALDERSGLVGLPLNCERVAAGDLNGDGMLDLAFLTERGCQLWINDRFWHWQRDPMLAPIEQASARRMVIAERADSGQPMVLAWSSGPAVPSGPPGSVVVWKQSMDEGERRWTTAGFASVPQTGEVPEIIAIDLIGVGEVQFLLSSASGASLHALDGHPISTIDATASAARTIAVTGTPPMPRLVEWSAAAQVIASRRSDSRWGNFVAVDLRGRADPSQSMRSNADGIGTRWAARSGGRWNGGWVLRNTSGPGQGQQPTLIGIGNATQLDALFIDWPDGVVQSELALKQGALHVIAETQRQISSCPVIFAWDGARFAFETDCLGVGGMGYLVGATRGEDGRVRPEYAPPRPRESIKLGTALQARDGAFEIRLTEPMEEACYLDTARLVQWRVPGHWHMVLDERMAINGPVPTGAMRFYRHAVEPVQLESRAGLHGAVDSAPARAIGSSDSAPARAIEFGEAHPRFIGRLREEGALTLVFPEAIDAHAGEPALVIEGWVEYPYSQTSFAMWQANDAPKAPSIDALDPETNEWITIVEQIGYPAGMTREALLPLVGDGIAPLPRGCTTLRLRTSVELFLDRVRLAWLEPCETAQRLELPLVAAEVAACGYPRKLELAQKRAGYDYQQRAPLWDCRTQPGFYTAFGDCTPLLRAGDGALAIFGPGEEVRLRFATAPLRSARTGAIGELAAPADSATADSSAEPAKSVFVLEVEGWCKDMCRYTGDGATLAPLPQRESAREGERLQREQLHRDFNTRLTGGR